jgi:hypothetical protein
LVPTDGRFTIAWDVDDVLNDLTRSWAESVGLEERFDDGVGGDPASYVTSLGFPPGEYLSSLDEFRAHRYGSLEPNPLTRLWFMRHGTRCDHVALTRTPLWASALVRAWVLEHFGRWITDVIVTPSRRPTDPTGTRYPSKGDVMASIREPAALVDDTEANLLTAREICRVVTFAQPWNSGASQEDSLAELTEILGLASGGAR